MKKPIPLFSICLLTVIMAFKPLVIWAQLSINVQLPPAGLIQKDQLWNLSLVNNQQVPLEIKLSMSLMDLNSGNTVLAAHSGNFVVTNGVKPVNSTDVQPVMYDYVDSDFSGTYLPIGNYIVCYQVFHEKGSIAEDCVNLNIEPLSPPLLSFPADNSELKTPYPNFSWLPPAPIDLFTSLRYTLLITEVLEGQYAPEAVENNLPVYFKTEIRDLHDVYPATHEKLDTGKVYAWQIVAENDVNYMAKTDVWTFKITGDTNEERDRQSTYILLETGVSGLYRIQNKSLYVKIYSFEKENNREFRFFDQSRNLVRTENRTIKPGDNYLDFNLRKDFREGEIYQLEVELSANKIHKLSFQIKPN